MQEVFVHVWLNAKKLGRRHERSILHYLVKVVRNKSISAYKEREYLNKKMARFSEGQSSEGFIDSPETQMIYAEMRQALGKLIVKFPKRECQCLMMRIDEELNDREISDRPGVSVKAVERSITSGRRRLRLHLGGKK